MLGRARRTGTTLGLDLDEYPLDFPHYARYDEAIQAATPARYPVPAPLTLTDVEEFLDAQGERYAVDWSDLHATV